MANRTPSTTASTTASTTPAPQANHEADKYFDGYLTALEGREKALHGFLSIVGDNPTYELWNGFRLGFCAVYRAKRPRAGDAAINVAWSRFVSDVKAYVEEQNLLQSFPAKPKASSPEAVRKQTARALPEAVAAATTLADLEKIEVPNGADGAELALAVAQRRVKLAKQAEATAAQSEKQALKELQGRVVAAARSCTCAKSLEAALVAMQAKEMQAGMSEVKAKAKTKTKTEVPA